MKKQSVLAAFLAATLMLTACGTTVVTNSGTSESSAAASSSESASDASSEEASADEGTTEEAAPVAEGDLQIGQVICAPHGNKAFGQVTAVVQGDVIVAAYIDEYQATDPSAVTAVPNADNPEEFGAGFVEEQTLFSKRTNAKYYSELMADHAGSTVALDANYEAIEAFAAGKTIAELEAYDGDENAADAVSGATLADSGNYLAAIAAAGKAAQKNPGVSYDGDVSNLKLNMAIGAAHGTKCFSTAAVLTDGTNIILAYIDEFQFGAPDAVEGVPNGTDPDGLGAAFAEGNVLFSKRVNADYYSDLMADHAGSTVRLDDNYDAVQAHVAGMSIADATALSNDETAVDAVSGATLADTANYIGLIVEAAK